MSNISQIKVEILKNNCNQSTINENVDFDSTNLVDYENILRDIQKRVNIELTRIVEQDKIDCTPADEEDIEGLEDDSDDEITKLACKRKLSSEKIKKKVKK